MDAKLACSVLSAHLSSEEEEEEEENTERESGGRHCNDKINGGGSGSGSGDSGRWVECKQSTSSPFCLLPAACCLLPVSCALAPAPARAPKVDGGILRLWRQLQLLLEDSFIHSVVQCVSPGSTRQGNSEWLWVTPASSCSLSFHLQLGDGWRRRRRPRLAGQMAMAMAARLLLRRVLAVFFFF